MGTPITVSYISRRNGCMWKKKSALNQELIMIFPPPPPSWWIIITKLLVCPFISRLVITYCLSLVRLKHLILFRILIAISLLTVFFPWCIWCDFELRKLDFYIKIWSSHGFSETEVRKHLHHVYMCICFSVPFICGPISR